MLRSFFKKLVGIVGVCALMAGSANAQLPPTGDITLIVSFPPGSFSNTSARLFAKYYSEALGRNVIVDTKPGAAGMIGLSYVQRSKPDGLTLNFVLSPVISLVPIIQKKTDFDTLKDITFIGATGKYEYVIITGANSKFKTIQELFAQAKGKANQISYGSGGFGASNHIGVEIMGKLAGAQMKHIPYKGNAAPLLDVIAGRIDFMLDFVGNVKPFIDDGKVRPLAMATQKRHPFLPNIPTVSELGGAFSKFEIVGTLGVVAPPGLPAGTKKTLEDAIKKVNGNPEFQKQMRDMGFALTPANLGGSDFQQSMVMEHKMWLEAVKNLPPL